MAHVLMGYSPAGPQLPVWLWLIPAGIICVPALVILAAVLLRARGSRSVLGAAGQPGELPRAHARRVTRCGLAGLGAGALTGLALVYQARGWLGVLACAAGYLAG